MTTQLVVPPHRVHFASLVGLRCGQEVRELPGRYLGDFGLLGIENIGGDLRIPDPDGNDVIDLKVVCVTAGRVILEINGLPDSGDPRDPVTGAVARIILNRLSDKVVERVPDVGWVSPAFVTTSMVGPVIEVSAYTYACVEVHRADATTGFNTVEDPLSLPRDHGNHVRV